MKQYLEVGKLNNTHGIKGELKLQLWCDGIEYLKQFKTLYLDDNGVNALEIAGIRAQKDIAIIKFKDIDTIEKAQLIKGKIVYGNRSDAKIEQGANYIADLIGCNVFDDDTNENYGAVKDVLNYGSCDIYEIESDGKRRLIPATKDIVKHINTESRVIKIKRMKGLFDED